MRTTLKLLAVALLVGTVQVPAQANRQDVPDNDQLVPLNDPRRREIPLPASPGWTAFHLHQTDSRVVVVAAERFTDYHGSPQVLVLDEKGRCCVLQSDSGKWTPSVIIEDGALLGAWAFADVDPRHEGSELYVGGTKGNLYQVVHRGKEGYAVKLAASIPGVSLGKFVTGDLDPARRGTELLAFSAAGPVLDLQPDAAAEGAFTIREIGRLPARVRDAVLLRAATPAPPRIVVVIQTGEVASIALSGDGIDRRKISQEPMSLARMARRESAAGEPEVIYVARVDGLILRFAERGDGGWTREIVYAGPIGCRGLVSGRFHEDPKTESIAVYGYSRKVQLLSRTPGGPWKLETVFIDCDRGHWLAAGELDGRNVTQELVGGGFGNRVFMVSRVPGYGLRGIPADLEPADG